MATIAERKKLSFESHPNTYTERIDHIDESRHDDNKSCRPGPPVLQEHLSIHRIFPITRTYMNMRHVAYLFKKKHLPTSPFSPVTISPCQHSRSIKGTYPRNTFDNMPCNRNIFNNRKSRMLCPHDDELFGKYVAIQKRTENFCPQWGCQVS